VRMESAHWDLVLAESRIKSYPHGKVILQEKSDVLEIFQVTSGRVKISKKTPEGDKDIGFLEQGALFGDMSFLDPENSLATATIIAEGPDVQISTLDAFFINLLFVYQPELAGRFYSYLCTVLATRIQERRQALRTKRTDAKSVRRSKTVAK